MTAIDTIDQATAHVLPWSGRERRGQLAEGAAHRERRSQLEEGAAPFGLGEASSLRSNPTAGRPDGTFTPSEYGDFVPSTRLSRAIR